MRPHPAVLAALLVARSAAADAPPAAAPVVPECTTTTTVVTRCTGDAAPYAVPQPEPPPPVATAPVYAPPPWIAPPGYEPPPGYLPPRPRKSHVEQKARYGLAIAGASVFGGSYIMNAVFGGWMGGQTNLAIPVVGPLLEAHSYNSSIDSLDRGFTVLMVFDALVQTTGAAMFIAGLASHHPVTVYDDEQVSLMVLPTAGPSFAGLAAVAHF
jgi:hypothetical protein